MLGPGPRQVHNIGVRRHFLIALTLVSMAIGPAALGTTPVERAHSLAELRLELPDLIARASDARLVRDRLERALDVGRAELEAVLAESVGALERLEQVERELRAARRRLDEGIQQLYIRGGSAALTVVMFFDDPTEAGIATHYLEALNASDTQSINDIARLLEEMGDLRHTAFESVNVAEADYAEHERAFVLAATFAADLEAQQARLEDRVDQLTAGWRDYRWSLVEDIITATGASGALAADSIEQGALRASLPLGPTIGVPPELVSTGRTLRGVASWYGPGFHGRRASSGAIFDERDFTVAHKTLPHGTLLLVTYGDKQAVVMVNDRGPFIEGREFDLSRATAEYLGLGLGRVKAEVLTVAP